MEDNLPALLKSFNIFSSLDDDTIQQLIGKLEKVDINQGEVLFHQGDPSNCIYLLVKGKLSAILTSAAAENKLVGYIDVGETVGESGAIINEPRSATIMAVTNSILYKFSSKDLLELCHQFPAVMFAVIHPIIARSQRVMQMLSADKIKKYIALVPANNEVTQEQFIEKLTEYASSFPNIIIVSDYSADIKDLSQEAVTEKLSQLAQNKKANQKILYLLKSYKSPLAKACMKKLDMLYLIANANSTPNIDTDILEKIDIRMQHHKPSPELILLHRKDTLAPKNTSRWLELAPFALHHHIRVGVNADLHRLVRFIRGKAVGLVLGGGGTRGWAHLGVIKALKEAKTPIDIIGGTSVGAIVAACYAIHLSYEEAYERFYNIVKTSRHSVSWRSFTWPAISMFNAKHFTLSQQEAFDKIQIEDLWIPYFCISSNLANNSEVVHRSGTLWEKTRSSSSIPGVIPPMVLNGELHYDGGLLNNLPVDVMKQIVGTKGKVVASELTTNHADTKYNFPPVLTFGQAFLAKMGWGYKDYKFPPFIDAFLKSIFVGSLLKAKQNSLSANLLISLDLSEYSMLHAELSIADELVEQGYTEALKQIGYRKQDDEAS